MTQSEKCHVSYPKTLVCFLIFNEMKQLIKQAAVRRGDRSLVCGMDFEAKNCAKEEKEHEDYGMRGDFPTPFLIMSVKK